MKQRNRFWPVLLGLLLLTNACAGVQPAASTPKASAACERATCALGFVVLAADRGFLGNEELLDAFEQARPGTNAELVFVTDERTAQTLAKALAALRARGATQVVGLPLFVSDQHPKLALARDLLRQQLGDPAPQFSRPFGTSYFAAEILGDQLRSLAPPQGKSLVVVGEGARDLATLDRMQADLQRLGERASSGFGFKSVKAVVSVDEDADESLVRESDQRLKAAIGDPSTTVVVPFALGTRLDSMMSLTASLQQAAAGATAVDADVTPHADVATWLRREFYRHLPRAAGEAGVVFLAHGADYHWNETMRESVAFLAERYNIEFAFSMADQPTIERAIRRLEARGARAIVVVRVFGLAASFRASVERMLGLDIEAPAPSAPVQGSMPAGHGHGGHASAGQAAGHGHDHGHGHGHGTPAAPPARIRTAALVTTVGGVEAHPLFADALLARARELSQSPAKETIILAAHGAGSDTQNEHWLRTLGEIAVQMRRNGGAAFRAIETGTWREDWPDKRDVHVRDLRTKVMAAASDGGRALVIPARTLGQGPERRFLEGLDYALGSGFAPHPLFARWFEEQISLGLSQLSTEAPAARDSATQSAVLR